MGAVIVRKKRFQYFRVSEAGESFWEVIFPPISYSLWKLLLPFEIRWKNSVRLNFSPFMFCLRWSCLIPSIKKLPSSSSLNLLQYITIWMHDHLQVFYFDEVVGSLQIAEQKFELLTFQKVFAGILWKANLNLMPTNQVSSSFV